MGSQMDRFVLSRKSNNVPELIFNQTPELDFDKKRRFFEIDHEMKWRISDNNSQGREPCHICERQQYCIIFYQRDKSLLRMQKNINKELIEVDDPVFIEKLRAEYRLKYCQISTSLKKMTTPLLFGTPVRNLRRFSGSDKITDITFDRKLRMMRADLFTLLSCSTNSEFISEAKDTIAIKKSVIKFLEGEVNARVDNMKVFSRLEGWNRLLHQKCNNNNVMSIHSVN